MNEYRNIPISYWINNKKELKNLIKNNPRIIDDKLFWTKLSIYRSTTDSFIIDFKDYLDWTHILENHKLNEKFIRRFDYKMNWLILSNRYILSENLLEIIKIKFGGMKYLNIKFYLKI